jgi:hypothetical protein
MSYNKATYVSLLFFAALGIVFYVSSMSIPKAIASQRIGPEYFPQIISVLLIVCCILSFFKTRKKTDEYIKLPNFRYIILTVILMILFVVIWGITENFYVTSFVFLGALIYIYNQVKQSFKKVLLSGAISLVLVAFVYVIFDRVLGITF